MSYAPLEALACDGRLTLLSGTPVPTTDQLAKTTIYFAPFRGNRIALYDGSSSWNLRTFAELSVAVPATTNKKKAAKIAKDHDASDTREQRLAKIGMQPFYAAMLLVLGDPTPPADAVAMVAEAAGRVRAVW